MTPTLDAPGPPVLRFGQQRKCPGRSQPSRGRTQEGKSRVSKQRTPKRVRVESVPNLYRRPADGRYEAGYTGIDGKWHIKTLSARTLTEAKAELRQVLGKRDQRRMSRHTPHLNEVADQFFAEFESKVSRGERASAHWRSTVSGGTHTSAPRSGADASKASASARRRASSRS